MTQLALDGGHPVRSKPFPARAHVGAEEQAAVAAVFAAAVDAGAAPGYNGPEELAYCDEFSAYLGGGYTDAVSSGTAGIYVALRALDFEPFGEVIVGAVTDPGGIMPIPLLNQIPVVADTLPGSYNTGPEQVEALLTPMTRAIVVAHIAGEPADVEGIVTLARARGIPVIEDCSQSHGALLHGRPVGSFGDIAVFSTMFGKHHSTGGQGGVVFTRDQELYHRIRRASDRGKPFGLPEGSTNALAALNLNLNDLAAAIGRVQLRKLPAIVARRSGIVNELAAGLRELRCVSLPPLVEGAESSSWFLRLRYQPEVSRVDKESFCQALAAEGLPIMADYSAALPHLMDWFVNRRVFGTSGYPWTSPEYVHACAGAAALDPDRLFPCPNARAAIVAHFNLMFHEAWTSADVADALTIFRKVAAAYQAAA
jgi:perosamine synthetase